MIKSPFSDRLQWKHDGLLIFKFIKNRDNSLIGRPAVSSDNKNRIGIIRQCLCYPGSYILFWKTVHVIQNGPAVQYGDRHQNRLCFTLGGCRRRKIHRQRIKLHHVKCADHEEDKKKKHNINHGNDHDHRLIRDMKITPHGNHPPSAAQPTEPPPPFCPWPSEDHPSLRKISMQHQCKYSDTKSGSCSD